MATTEDLIAKANAMVAQTKAQGTTPFAGSSYATAPTNVGDINTSVTDTKISTPTTQQPDITGANAYNEGSKTSTQAYIEQFQKDQLAREEARKTESKSFLDKMFAGQKDATTLASEAESAQKLDEKFVKQQEQETKISTLTKSYNELKDEVQKQKDALLGQGRGITTDFLNNQAAQIDRNAVYKFNSLATEINFETAMLSIFKEDYNNAQDKADKAVQYALADQKSDLEMYKTFYEDNQQSFENVEKIYSDSFSNLIKVKEDELKTAEANKTYAMDNALKYNSMGAGITVNDSPEVVAQKVSNVGGELGYYKEQQRIQDQFEKKTTPEDKPVSTTTVDDIKARFGITVPYGTTQKVIDDVFTGWTDDDTKKYKNNTNGFKDTVDGILGIPTTTSSGPGWFPSLMGGITTGIKNLLTPTQTQPKTTSYKDMLPDMSGYQGISFPTIKK